LIETNPASATNPASFYQPTLLQNSLTQNVFQEYFGDAIVTSALTKLSKTDSNLLYAVNVDVEKQEESTCKRYFSKFEMQSLTTSSNREPCSEDVLLLYQTSQIKTAGAQR